MIIGFLGFQGYSVFRFFSFRVNGKGIRVWVKVYGGMGFRGLGFRVLEV